MTRQQSELKTLSLMIHMHCRACHTHDKAAGLCPQCRELLRYSAARIGKCPQGAAKRSCRVCEIHCYSPLMKERICQAMRYAGPRIIFHAPLATLRHLCSEWGLHF